MTARTPDQTERVDVSDVLIAGGFLAFVGGIALLSVPWALIVGGSLLAVTGYCLGVRRGTSR